MSDAISRSATDATAWSRQLARALAGPYGITPALVVVYLAASIGYGFCRQLGLGVRPFPAVFVAVIASSVGALGLFAFSPLRLRIRRPWLRAMSTATAFGLAGAVVGIGTVVTQQLAFADPVQHPAGLIANSTIEALAWLCVTVVVGDRLGGYHRQRNELLDSLARLRVRRARSTQELQSATDQLVGLVDNGVTRKIRTLIEVEAERLRDDPNPEQVRETAKQLSVFTREVVRPLSHQLDAEVPVDSVLAPTESPAPSGPAPSRAGSSSPDQDTSTATKSKTRIVRELVRDAGLHHFPPGLVTIVAVVLVIAPMFQVLGPGQGTLTIVLDAIVLLVVLEASRLLYSAWSPASPLAGILFQLAALGIAGVLVAVTINAVYREEPWPFGTLLAAAWTMTIGSCVIGLLAADRLGRRTRRDLIAATELSSWQARRLDAEVRNVRRSVAYVLHGNVQGGLTAVSMLLDKAADLAEAARESGDPVMRQQAGTYVTDAMDQLDQVLAEADGIRTSDNEHPKIDLADGLAAVVRSWRGLLQVELDLDDAMLDQIAQDDRLSRAVVEVFREALSNAARHGLSSQVWATAAIADRWLVLDFVDDGSGPARGAIAAGLGIRAIERTGATCTLEAAPEGGAHLQVRMPAPLLLAAE